MNKSLREALSWANEIGLCLSLLIAIGYFGVRQSLGFLPGVALFLFVAAGIGLIIMIAGQRGEDEFGESNNFDKILWWVACFLVGTAAVTAIGAVL